jgi:ATP-binding cassette subfamily C protein
MRVLYVFARQYPGRSLLMLGALILASLAEGLGISGLLPLMNMTAAGPSASQESSRVEQTVTAIVGYFGFEPTIGVLVGVIVIGMSIKALLVLLAQTQVGYTVAHVATDLRLTLIRALLRTRWSYYVSQPVGTFANAIASEAHRASDAYLQGTRVITCAILTLVYIAVALAVSWQVTLVAVAGGMIIVYALRFLVRVTRKAGIKQTKLNKGLLTSLTDSMQSIKPLKAMARESLVGPLLENQTQRLNRALQKEVLSKEALGVLQELLIVVFLAVGAYVALARFDESLATVIMLTLLCARMLSKLGALQKELQRLVTSESAFWSIRTMIDAAEGQRENWTGSAAAQLRHSIRLDHVRFGYDERVILDDACMTVPAGQLTVITGPSGAGKTTVADLISGLLLPQQGDVYVDDTPLREVDLRQWRASIGYVPQDTILLHESIFLNITLGDPTLTRADAENALRAAGAWDFVQSLPDALDRIVGERGLRISGGQRQRIALARALVHKPQLLLLDEATTALDPATERAICDTLVHLRGAITIVAIAHHGRLVELADHAFRVVGGSVTPLSADEIPRLRAAAGGGAD